MINAKQKTLGDRVVTIASRLWRFSGLKSTHMRVYIDSLSHYPIPFGLSSPYGTLYGWNFHEKLHSHEDETVAFFKQNLRPGDTIADIGTNIGYFTLLFSALVGNTGTVVSFEPSPGACANLKKAVREKKNVTVVNKGIFSRPDVLRLYAKINGDPMGSVVYKRGEIYSDIEVIPLRDYPMDFIWAKIDVEGAELEVLRGMKKPIRSVLEVAKGIIEKHGEGLDTFFSNIEALGYTVYYIVENGATIERTRENLHLLRDNIYIEPKK